MEDEYDDPRLLEAVEAYSEAVRAGKRPEREEFLARYPGCRERLLAFIQEHDRMEALTEGLRATAGIGAFLPPGSRVGNCEILGVIGQGGMGVIYLARHVLLGKTVALKMIAAGRLATPEDRERFRIEAKAAASMDHPNIVPLFDFSEHEGQPYYTMGLIEGHALNADGRDFMGFPDEAARLIATVAGAMHHAHQRQIIHRDLKPANIMIDDAGVPHVTDFGLAMSVEGSRTTDPNVLIGTLPYMAPEQLGEEARRLTTSVDQWSLGVILYELLTGRVPFQGKAPIDTIDQIRQQSPAPIRSINPRVPRDLEAICMKCLEKDPERRFGSTLDLAMDLERWLRGEPTRARLLGPVSRLWRWCRRKPAAAGLAVASIALLVMAALAAARHASDLRVASQELRYTSSAVADRVLMRLKDWSGAVVQAAEDPDLHAGLGRKDPAALRAFLDRAQRAFEARWSAPQEEKSPSEHWIVFDDRGVMIACLPHEEKLVGKDFSHREWFAGARRRAGKRGLDSVHVSRIFTSLVGERLSKFTLSVPLYDSAGADARVTGVLAASFTTHSNLGISELNDERHRVVMVGLWDPDSGEKYSPSDYFIFAHPAYTRGEQAVKVHAPSLRRLASRSSGGELRSPGLGHVGVVDEEYEDPLGDTDARYKGLWRAGIAPVGTTPFMVIVQKRPPSWSGRPRSWWDR